MSRVSKKLIVETRVLLEWKYKSHGLYLLDIKFWTDNKWTKVLEVTSAQNYHSYCILKKESEI